MDRVIGRLCTALGIEPARAWVMEWADVARLYRYWRDSPPVHELVAAYLGVKPAGTPAVEVSTGEMMGQFKEFTRAFAGAEKRAVA